MADKGTSRRGFLKGSAIAGAGALAAQGGIAAAEDAAADAPVETYDFDVVVVGAGAAGMWAALDAQAAGAKVALLEKNDSSLLSACALCLGGIIGAGTKVQLAADIVDTPDDHLRDHMRFTRYTADPELARAFVDEVGPIIDWFTDQGIEMIIVPHVVNKLPVADRIHFTVVDGRPLVSGNGRAFAEALVTAVAETDIRVFYDTPGRELITSDEGNVVGMLAENADGEVVQFNAKAVVLATGGFPANREMLAAYNHRQFDGSPAPPGNTGDGIKMGMALGAMVENMDISGGIIAIPAGALGAYPAPNTLWVNSEGQRFVGEHAPYWLATPRLIDQDRTAWAFFDAGVVEANGWAEEALPAAQARGLVAEADTIEGLADYLTLDPLAVTATVDQYNFYCDAGEDVQFGKPAEMLQALTTPPFYAVRLLQGYSTSTFGGLVVNAQAQVLNWKKKPIVGLYAAGNDSTGMFGRTYPGSGTGIGASMSFGRIAGRNAAAFALGD